MALTQEQLRNAQLIYQVGKAMGLGTRDIQIGLITAMQESSLVNVNYGDRDSLGLFQQRPSQGWGTPAQVTDPQYAARKFFTTLKQLGESRFEMSMTEAAQAVQRSAYPDAYAKHIGLVRDLYPKISGGGPSRVGTQPVATDRNFNVENPVELSVNEIGTFESPAPMSPMAMLGAAYNPMVSAPDPYGIQPESDWAPVINPLSIQILRDRDAAGDIDMPFSKGTDGWRKAVIQAARSAIGTPYVWGGNSLQNGVDCSGLLQQAFAQAGINLPRVSYQQANYGKRVDIKALQPGDLVAWDNSSRNAGADHIALYIGNGKIIEAARPGTKVRVRALGQNEGAWGVRIDR